MADEMNSQEIGWNDEISNEGQDYILVPEGEYEFVITGFERGRFPGSAKIDPCNKATLTLSVDTPVGKTSIRTDLILTRSLEWKLCAFFRCIGQKKHGEKLVMDWSKVVGSKGRAYIKQKKYTNNFGEEKTFNDVDRYLEPKAEDDSDNGDDAPF